MLSYLNPSQKSNHKMTRKSTRVMTKSCSSTFEYSLKAIRQKHREYVKFSWIYCEYQHIIEKI